MGSKRTFSEEHRRNLSIALKGKKKSPEHKEALGRSAKGRRHTEEWKQHEREAKRGIRSQTGEVALGYCFIEGYKVFTGVYDHPLSSTQGHLPEHRMVLYEKIGPGPHNCHWCDKEVSWGGKQGLCADHLDDDRSNNDPENLVPSCYLCNWRRGPRT